MNLKVGRTRKPPRRLYITWRNERTRSSFTVLGPDDREHAG